MISEKRLKKIRDIAKNTLNKKGWGDSAVSDLLKAYDEQRKLIWDMANTLAFYADPQTYFAITFIPDPPNGEFMDDFNKCEDEYGEWIKPGKRARKALDKIKSILIDISKEVEVENDNSH
jgi:hypothetical protein